MIENQRLSASPEATVTASEFVRSFGIWQERALQEPVFVLRRGRPSLVLTSVDLMRRLCEPHEMTAETSLGSLLLDATREVVLVADERGRIEQANRTARIAFGPDVVGHLLARPFGEAVASFLLDIADRARRSGSPGETEIAVRERRYRLAVIAFGKRTLFVADDVSAESEGDATANRLASLEDALFCLGNIAWANLNLRGYVEKASESLEYMTGFDRLMLQSVRFITLLEPLSRQEVADAIEAVIVDGAPRSLSARLQLRDGKQKGVKLALVAGRGRHGVERLTIAITESQST
ncbi:hypothetical protein [Sphingomonas sp. Y38-1Y]|uniref:hypothetical protein n=1 Tax=Sphingomonas sp. Y38-1Y TaxID=3078265 RepID=UPI0028E7967C|nr:hypothetical protein [Sphingomonas sp. Y38-1Y]